MISCLQSITFSRSPAGICTRLSTTPNKTKTGYYYILGRTDDVINVAGHRIGTREVEETINSHADIAESAAIGAYDEIKGQAIHCFAVVRQGAAKGEPELKKEILQIILRHLGAIARPAAIHIVKGLPKTRSGKIVRRAIQAVVEGKQPGRSEHA